MKIICVVIYGPLSNFVEFFFFVLLVSWNCVRIRFRHASSLFGHKRSRRMYLLQNTYLKFELLSVAQNSI